MAREATVRRGSRTHQRGAGPPTAFAASAKRLPLDNGKALQKLVAKRLEWQDEAWDYFDEIPEIKYSMWFLGNAASKLRLFAAVRPANDPDADPIPVVDPGSGIGADVAARAQLELDRLKSPIGGQGEICRELNMNLEVAAEGYLVGIGPRVDTVIDPETKEKVEVVKPEEWSIRSVSEVEVEGSGTRIVYTVRESPSDKGIKLDPKTDTIIRIWQRHPRWSFMPDNNMRGVLDECQRLVQLSQQISAEAKSAMSAGVFTIPNELSFGPADPAEPEDGESETDPLDEELEIALSDPVEDPASASAVNPMTLRGPGEWLDPKYVRQIVFARPMSAVLEERIMARIERIARGMNLPVEVVMGHQQTTYANAAQVDEDTFEDHLQPRCELICDALTVGFLQPNLIEAGYAPEIVEQIIVWYDPKRLLKQADPVEHVELGLADGLISDEAGRRYLGFSEEDAPTAEERLIRTIMHLRTFDPGVSTAILKLLGVPLDIPTELPGSTSGAASADGQVDNALVAFVMNLVTQKRELEAHTDKVTAAHSKGKPDNLGRRFMDEDRDLRTRILTAADRTMTRVLERAGNRLKAKRIRGKQDLRSLVRSTHPLYAAQTVGPRLLAAAGFTEDDLIGTDAWDDLEGQFRAWCGATQAKALDMVQKATKLSSAARDVLDQQQARDLDAAWEWMADALHQLAVERLYGPDPHVPDVGEHDPTMKVPVGLVRQALTRAGGATGLTTDRGKSVKAIGSLGNMPYVVLNNGEPPGGIATGELVMGALKDQGATVDAYEWEYGPAFRAHPFEEHEALDGEIFASFEADVLAAGDWIGDFYFPGDHDGCACDVAPTIALASDLDEDEQALTGDSSDATDMGDDVSQSEAEPAAPTGKRTRTKE